MTYSDEDKSHTVYRLKQYIAAKDEVVRLNAELEFAEERVKNAYYRLRCEMEVDEGGEE